MGTMASTIVSVVNQGTTAVNVSQISVSGQAFSLSGDGNLPVTVAAGGTYSVNVNFVPTGIGAAAGQLTIASNASNDGTLVVGLSGTGTGTTVGATPIPILTSLSCASNGATGSAIDTCTVALNSAAANGGFAVNLSSDDSAVAVPPSVTVAAGSTTASFIATISPVSSSQTATLIASASGIAETFALQLNASYLSPGSTGNPALNGLSCTFGSMTGGGSDGCAVTLSAAAPDGGFVVNLASNNPAVTLPATVTVAAGSAIASFTATVSPVNSAQTVTLTASSDGTAVTFALQLNVGAPGLSANATSIAFGIVPVNTTATQSVELTSSGVLPITIVAATVQGVGFSITGATFPLTLAVGQPASIEVTFDPTAAGATTGQLTLLSTAVTNGVAVINLSGTGELLQVNLSWDAPTSSPDPVAGYNVYRAPSGGTSYQQLNYVVVTQTAYVDLTVASGQTYDYIVESVDASGVTSGPSNMASVTLP